MVNKKTKDMAELRKLKVTEMNRLTVEEFKEARKLPLVVVLDDVRSLHNIGAVMRHYRRSSPSGNAQNGIGSRIYGRLEIF